MTGTLAIFVGVSPKYGSLSMSGVSVPSSARERGPWTASTAQSSLTSSMPTSSRPVSALEVGEIRLGGREQELLRAVAQDDAVLDDEAAVVAPGRVLRVARCALADVADEDAGQEPFRVGAA